MMKKILLAITVSSLAACGGSGGSSSGGGTDSAGGQKNAAPSATNPNIQLSGSGPWVGTQVNGGYSYQDAENDSEGSSTFRWLREGIEISGATALSYTLQADDVDKAISFEVIPVASAGTLLGQAVVSQAVTAKENTAPTANNVRILLGDNKTPLAELTGNSWAGEVLTADYSYNDAEQDLQSVEQTKYRWLVDGEEASTALVYTSQKSDAGKNIIFEVTVAAKTGTLAGQEAVTSAVGQLTARQQVFFTANKSSQSSPDSPVIINKYLFISNGLEADTQPLLNLGSSRDNEASKPVAFFPAIDGGQISQWLFTAKIGSAHGLKVTDGTEAGTQTVLTNLGNPVVNPQHLTAFNGYIYFQASGDGTDDGIDNNKEIWRSDGTQAGTVLAADLNSLGHSNPTSFTVMGDHLYFLANTDKGNELYRLDKSDSYELVKDINPGSAGSTPTGLTVFKDKLYFQAWDGSVPSEDDDSKAGNELWVSDGTEAGTSMVTNILDGHSYPQNLTVFNDSLYFTVSSNGLEEGTLYKTQGSTDSTKFVKSGVTLLTSFNDRLIYKAGTVGTPSLKVIWGFKPSTSGGYGVHNNLSAARNPGVPAVLSDRIMFSSNGLEAQSSSGDYELYYAENNDFLGGRVNKVDVNSTESSSPSGLTSLNGRVLFSAKTSDYGRELWSTDGTEAGTLLLKDLAPGAASSEPNLNLSSYISSGEF
jgi:ELWxxDGT repeat protein